MPDFISIFKVNNAAKAQNNATVVNCNFAILKEKKPRNKIKTSITDVKKLVVLSFIISRQKNKKQQKSEPSR
ncbi:MAG: hypothetical protein IT271_05235 [Chitinophagales bacterium]|nr:hypothetical protein [Chitinophagales bacterium]